jgi:hypothetical protein
MHELSHEERQYIRIKKSLEYEYAAGYLPVNALERMDEDDLRTEVQTVIREYLPPDERRELAVKLAAHRRRLFGDEHDLAVPTP